MTTDTLPPATRVGRVALRVGDLDREVEFYRDVVGLSVLDRSAERARLGVGEEPLLALRAAPDAPARDRHETGLYHTAFRVPTRAALADALARIRDRWHLDGASDHRVSEALYLSDPEGNGVEVYCDRPQSDWPTVHDRVRMTSDPLDVDALAEAGSGADAPPAETTVGHVHLEVSDLDRARAFYVDCLGTNVRASYGDQALFVAAGDYHHHVGLNVWNDRTDPPSGRGLEWFELVVPDGDTLTGVAERMPPERVERPDDVDGIRLADPDGIRVRVRSEA